MDISATTKLDVFLKQAFQFWYDAALLPHLGLPDADVTANFVRLLRVLEDQPLHPLFPINDIAESGWSIMNIMLDSIDKAEGLLQLSRPSSTSMAGRIVEVSIAVSKLLAAPPPPLLQRPMAARPPVGPAVGRPMGALGHGPTAPSPCPSPPTASTTTTAKMRMPMTDMRDEYFQGACHSTALSPESLFGLVRPIVPEAAFTYAHPVPGENIPLIVASAVAWGLGSKAMLVTPTRLASLTYVEVVNALVLSGKSLHRSAIPGLSSAKPGPVPGPGGPPKPGMASNGGTNNGARGTMPLQQPWGTGPPIGMENYVNRGPPPPGMLLGMYCPSRPFPTAGQPRPGPHGQDARPRWVPGPGLRQEPPGWRHPPGPPGSMRTASPIVSSDSDRATSDSDSSSSSSDSGSDSSSDSDSGSESEDERADCACSKKTMKGKAKSSSNSSSSNNKGNGRDSKRKRGTKGKTCRACKCKEKKNSSKNKSRDKDKKDSAAKHGCRNSKNSGGGINNCSSRKRHESAWHGTDSDSSSEDDSDASSSHHGSVTDSDVDSDSETVVSGTGSAPSVTGVDSDSELDSRSGSDSDGWAKEGVARKKKSRRQAKAAAKHCCHKCEHRAEDFVIVSRRGARK